MSIYVFPLSHQAGTIWRHTCSSRTCFSATDAALRFYSPFYSCRAIQIGRLLWYFLRRRWESLCKKSIHWQTCPVCFLRSILLLILINPWINNNPRISILVCSAWAYSNGCKSLTSPNSGNRIANSKGVHCEVESERSWRQTSDLTYRNFIQGIWPWMRLQDKSKSHSYSEWLV